MPNPRSRTELAYPEDISFTRLFLGLGPKTIRQPIKPKLPAPAPKPVPTERIVLNLGGKMYSVVDIKKAPAVAPSAPPPPAAATPPPAPPDPPAPEAPAAAPEPAATVEPAAEPAAAAPASPDAEAANPVPVWTDVQDAMLLGLKAIGKTWKEIGALVEGKDTEDLRERYDEITAAKPAEKNEKKKAEAAKDEGETTDATEEESEAKKGKTNKNEKNKNKNKKKDDQGDAASQEESDDAAEEATTKKDKKNKNKQPRGILKPDDAPQTSDGATADPDDDLPRFYDGHPIIYIDPTDGLTPNELQHLFKMYQQIEQNKWLQMASRLFDKTGKRVSPDLLREKFENVSPY